MRVFRWGGFHSGSPPGLPAPLPPSLDGSPRCRHIRTDRGHWFKFFCGITALGPPLFSSVVLGAGVGPEGPSTTNQATEVVISCHDQS